MSALAKLGEKSDGEKSQESACDVESDVFESILDEIIMPNYPKPASKQLVDDGEDLCKFTFGTKMEQVTTRVMPNKLAREEVK